MKKYLVLLALSGCATVTYEYQVHLAAESGEGSTHLITTETKQEAEQFITNQKPTHGDGLSIIKIKK